MARIDTRSRIPVATQKLLVSPLLDLLHINRLLDMNQNLVKRSEQKVGYRHVELPTVKSQFSRHLDRQRKLEAELELLLKEVRASHEELLTEVVELRRGHKKVLHRIADLESKITTEKGRFEFAESRIMKNVLHREQMMNLQVKELSNKLASEYNEAKFQLQDELAAARNYNDTELLAEKRRLVQETAELEKMVAEAKADKKRRFEAEAATLEAEMNSVLAAKTGDASRLEDEYQAKLSQLQDLERDVEKSLASIDACKDEIDSLNLEIAETENRAVHFEEDKSRLLQQLVEVEFTVAELRAQVSKQRVCVDEEAERYTQKRDQFHEHNVQRRILENAIMDYEKGPRVYAKGPHTSLSFQKNFERDASNQSIIDEFLLFVSSSFKQMTTCCILISGHQMPGFALQTMSECFSLVLERSRSLESTFEYALRCIQFSLNPPLDLLDSQRPVHADLKNGFDDLRSQKMVVDSPKDLSSIPLPQQDAYLMVLSAYTITNGRKQHCDLAVADISGADLDHQANMLLGQDPATFAMFEFISRKRCLHVSQPNEMLVGVLEQVQHRK